MSGISHKLNSVRKHNTLPLYIPFCPFYSQTYIKLFKEKLTKRQVKNLSGIYFIILLNIYAQKLTQTFWFSWSYKHNKCFGLNTRLHNDNF